MRIEEACFWCSHRSVDWYCLRVILFIGHYQILGLLRIWSI